jgi:hypothetical protein
MGFIRIDQDMADSFPHLSSSSFTKYQPFDDLSSHTDIIYIYHKYINKYWLKEVLGFIPYSFVLEEYPVDQLKLKFSLFTLGKHEGSRGRDPLILNFGTWRSCVVISLHGRFSLGTEPTEGGWA